MEINGKEYEILVRRRGEGIYSAFCPQLELIVNGSAHVQVEEKMKLLIAEHVKKQEESASGADATK